ncbi:MAG: class I SAM-dependent methyltransferase [Candidatus Cloacimonetes bacterium]|nr:class I SAM-dependent methyltransferase [Candidatus Cloacimonadota bacterium]
MSETKKFTEANRKAWNAAMPYHRKARDVYWDSCLADPSFVFQQEPELALLQEVGISGKAVVQLCCNNGLELMSIKRLGAKRCVGFDICDEAIKDANKRSAKYNIGAEFFRHSVYEIPEAYHNLFDLVYISIGALCWLPNLGDLFAVVNKLLKKGGELFIYEQHPFTAILPWDVSGNQDRAYIEYSYFQEGYQEYYDSLDYYGNESYESPIKYEFTHTLADVISAILSNGMRLSRFREYEHDISNGFAWVQKTGLRLPLCYILTAVKD